MVLITTLVLAHFAGLKPPATLTIPDNSLPFRRGMDAKGKHVFPGQILQWNYWDRALDSGELSMNPQGFGSMPSDQPFRPTKAFTLKARIRLDKDAAGRIFDKVSPGKRDGLFLEVQPGRCLCLVVGSFTLSSNPVLTLGKEHTVAAVFGAQDSDAFLVVDGQIVALYRTGR